MLDRRSYRLQKTAEGFKSKLENPRGNMNNKKYNAILEDARSRSKAKQDYIMSQNIQPIQAGIRKGSTAIDLQAIGEVPTGNQFSTDDFNRYMGVMSTLGKSKFYQDKIDDYYLKNRQAMDIEMMNLGTGPKAPINPETGKPYERIERYDAIQELKRGMLQAKLEEQGGKSYKDEMKIRRAEDSPLPGDVVDAKLEPGEYVLNRNAVKAIGKEKLDKINNKIAPRFSSKEAKRKANLLGRMKMGADGSYKKYLQTGSAVEEIDLRDKEDEMGFGMNASDYVEQAEGIGEKALEDTYKFGKKAYGGAKDILGKLYNRFGGEAFKAGKARNLQAELNSEWAGGVDGEAFEGQEEFEESNLEMAKMLRDEMGLGKGDYGMAAGQFGQRVADDIQTGIGGAIMGAGALGKGAQDIYNQAKQKFGEGKKKIHTYLSDDTGYEEDFDKVMRGEARGSNMQRVGKTTSFLGSMFDQLASFQGFGEGADMSKYSKQKKLTDIQVDTENEKEKTPIPENDVLQANYDQALEKARILKEKGYELPETLLEAEANQIGPRKPDGSFQLGGSVTMEGFIQQAFRNVYGN